METFSIYTKDKEQARTVKAFLKALEIPFESSAESPYDPDFVTKIKEGEKEFREGNSTTVESEAELRSFLGIDEKA